MIFIDNKYTKWYYQIIDDAKQNPPTEYSENHHIVPKCLGGNDIKDNLVLLTARQHFICHRLLTKMTKRKARSKMALAVWAFVRASGSQERIVINSRTYEHIRKERSLAWSETYAGKNAPFYGKSHSEETIEKIKSKTTGQKRSKETREKMKKSFASRPQSTKEYYTDERRKIMSEARSGIKHTPETCAKISEAHKGKNPVWTQTKWQCEHCHKEGIGVSNYNRWHGDNCKMNNEKNT